MDGITWSAVPQPFCVQLSPNWFHSTFKWAQVTHKTKFGGAEVVLEGYAKVDQACVFDLLRKSGSKGLFFTQIAKDNLLVFLGSSCCQWIRLPIHGQGSPNWPLHTNFLHVSDRGACVSWVDRSWCRGWKAKGAANFERVDGAGTWCDALRGMDAKTPLLSVGHPNVSLGLFCFGFKSTSKMSKFLGLKAMGYTLLLVNPLLNHPLRELRRFAAGAWKHKDTPSALLNKKVPLDQAKQQVPAATKTLRADVATHLLRHSQDYRALEQLMTKKLRSPQ